MFLHINLDFVSLDCVKKYERFHADSFTELVGGHIVNSIVQAPRTVENFRSLATGELGVNEKGVALHYKNTTFHRVVHGLLVQGGDILSKSSTHQVMKLACTCGVNYMVACP